ncbi:MAG: hypothetical protein HQL01_06905 [Nitrospirae bacterium]|nr:hypothetical protein [Nitrospirota bacterium]
MKTKAILIAMFSVVLVILATSALYADRTLPRRGGKGYVQCVEGIYHVNKKNEVIECILAQPLTYNVYGGTDVCPQNNIIRFDYNGEVSACKPVKRRKN